MPRARRRPAGPDMKGPEEKRTKTKNLGRASAQVENSSLQKTPVFEDSGEALSSYWLMKSEPESRLEKGVDVKFSIEDLQAQPRQTTCWDGVRNYQARNFLRAMRLDEEAFFYHSNCREPGIAGLVKIVKEAYPDHTQFEKNNPHYDASSKEDNPKWSMVKLLLSFPAHGWTEGGGSGVSRAGHRAPLVSEATLPLGWRTGAGSLPRGLLHSADAAGCASCPARHCPVGGRTVCADDEAFHSPGRAQSPSPSTQSLWRPFEKHGSLHSPETVRPAPDPRGV